MSLCLAANRNWIRNLIGQRSRSLSMSKRMRPLTTRLLKSLNVFWKYLRPFGLRINRSKTKMWIVNYLPLMLHLAGHLHMPYEFHRFGWTNVASQCAMIHSLNPRRKKTMFLSDSTWTDIEQWILLTIKAPDQLYLDRFGKWVAVKEFPSAVGEELRFCSECGLCRRHLNRVKVVFRLLPYPGMCEVKTAFPVV